MAGSEWLSHPLLSLLWQQEQCRPSSPLGLSPGEASLGSDKCCHSSPISVNFSPCSLWNWRDRGQGENLLGSTHSGNLQVLPTSLYSKKQYQVRNCRGNGGWLRGITSVSRSSYNSSVFLQGIMIIGSSISPEWLQLPSITFRGRIFAWGGFTQPPLIAQ